ncbi:hypothetical protein GCM10012275_08910 [Longimycelium tulufanense]|uniref:Uncharacterized protein n=1 Tax=Longimycelium tulufanense TaxID=907463 RepID=A0A8J3CAS3_9PSEU|nr:hypothetical protein GCM10012275_08910 [Longimycelium tulufanense]
MLGIETSWTATAIDGDPGIGSGSLSVSRAVGGEFLLNLSVGPPGGAPENFIYPEFPCRLVTLWFRAGRTRIAMPTVDSRLKRVSRFRRVRSGPAVTGPGAGCRGVGWRG